MQFCRCNTQLREACIVLHAIYGEWCLLLVLELDWLAPILWEQHLLPLFDVHRNNLSILQVSPTWASGNY